MDSRRLLLLSGVVVFVPLLVATGSLLVDGDSRGGSDGADTATPTRIDSCTTISEPGRYELVADIVNDEETHLSESCIQIESDDVILDGGGHRVDGRGVSGTIGVHVASSGRLTNVSVIRLTVSDWDWGVHYEGVTGGEVRAVTAESNGAGVSLAETRGVTVRDTEISNNGIGVYLLDAADNSIRHTTVSDNLLGIDCDGADANAFAANTLASNRATGAPSDC